MLPAVRASSSRRPEAELPEPEWIALASWRMPQIRINIGAKARGLTAMPAAWVPDFISVVPRSSADHRAAELACDWTEVTTHLRGHELLLVRSDGPDESDRPGAGATITTAPDGLQDALAAVRSYAAAAWPLVQVAIEPSAVGVLSNDRRVSPRRDVWMAEGPITAVRPEVVMLGPAARASDVGRPLGASTDLRPALRAIARHLAPSRRRYRVEWVWDGNTIWIVQADEREDPVTNNPAALRQLRRHGPLRPPTSPSSERHEWDGPKVRSHQTFTRLGLPTVPVLARRGDRLRDDRELREWLTRALAAHTEPIVLRTDVSTKSSVLLPTSAPSRDVDDLARFAAAALKAVTEGDVNPENVALLASPLVPAVASTLAMLDETEGCVEIDSLWGFPDGLLYLPHDSTTVRGTQVEMQRRHKPACLILSTNGERFEALLGAPWDWGRTIREDEARTIATWTRRVSDLEGRRVQLMVLARVGGRRGEPGLLPFHFFEQPLTGSHDTEPAVRGRPICVHSFEDLPARVDGGWIELRPRLDLARDHDFLAAVAQFATTMNLPIGLSGSRLGHARYVLEQLGASVFFAADTPAVVRTVAVLARRPGRLLRLVHVTPEVAAAAVGIDLDQPTALDVAHLRPPSAQLPTHPAMPGVPLLSDTASASLGPVPDLPGQPTGFME